jgi:hypothetical protein
MASSKCDQLRAKGNAEYKQLSKGSCVFAAPVRRRKLVLACQQYMDALGCSHTAAERAACFKNLGMLHVMWGKFEFKDAMEERAAADSSKLACLKPRLLIAVKHLLEALREGKSADRPEAWLEHLHGVLLGLVEWVVEQTRVLGLSSAPLLRWLCDSFDIALDKSRVRCKAAVIAHLRLAEELFQQGILKLGDDEDEIRDFRGCLASMHDCSQFLRKAQSFSANCDGQHTANGLLPEIKELEERAQLQIFVCESMQALRTGDQVLEKALFDDEEVNMDLAMQAVDFYRSAVLLTRERDIEGEAIATSQLGRVFSDVLKDTVRASKFHYQATKLALTVMSPRIGRSRWYKYSRAKHAEYQEQVVRNEERAHEQKWAPTKKGMEKELKKLNQEAKKGGLEFLLYIYKNHPKPDPKKVPGVMPTEEGLTKQMLRSAILYYHPDVNRQHPEEWQVLCQEICKILNNFYENCKLAK